MAEWKIERRTGQCRRCERAFEAEERFASCLNLVGEELLREDLCLSCFKAQVAGTPSELFWWFLRYVADKKKTIQLDVETLEQVFLSMEGRSERLLQELRYLLCLLLLRKKRLKVERIERGAEGESFLVRRPRRDQRFRVFIYDFDSARMAELRTKLQAVFDGAEIEEGLRLASAEERQESSVAPSGETGPDEAGLDEGELRVETLEQGA